MKLSDLYAQDRDEQAMVLVNLETIANMLDGWRGGGEVDSVSAHSACRILLAIAQRAELGEPEANQ